MGNLYEVERRKAYLSYVGSKLKEVLKPKGYVVESFQYLVGITIKFPAEHDHLLSYRNWLYELLKALPETELDPVKVTFNIEDQKKGEWIVINPPEDYGDELKWQIDNKIITADYERKKKKSV